MNRSVTSLFKTLAVAALIASFTGAAAAQAGNSNVGTVSLAANLPESVTVTITGGSTVNIPLAPNTAVNAAAGTSSVTTEWTLKPGRTSLAVWAYFSSSTDALVGVGDPANKIPSSAVSISVNGGSFNAMTSTSPFVAAASGFQLHNINITGTNKSGTQNSTLAFQVDTTFDPQLPADDYAGTLNIQAQATP